MMDSLTYFTAEDKLAKFRPWWDIFTDYVVWLGILINTITSVWLMQQPTLLHCIPFVNCKDKSVKYENKTRVACERVLEKGKRHEMAVAFSNLQLHTFTNLSCSEQLVQKAVYSLIGFVVAGVMLVILTNVWYKLPKITRSLRFLSSLIDEWQGSSHKKSYKKDVLKSLREREDILGKEGGSSVSKSRSGSATSTTRQIAIELVPLNGDNGNSACSTPEGGSAPEHRAQVNASVDSIKEWKESLEGSGFAYMLIYILCSVLRILSCVSIFCYVGYAFHTFFKFSNKGEECHIDYEYDILWSRILCRFSIKFLLICVSFLNLICAAVCFLFACKSLSFICKSCRLKDPSFMYFWYLLKQAENVE